MSQDTNNNKHCCSREKEIDRLLDDCEQIKVKENKLEMAINDLKNKFEIHIETMMSKFEELGKKIDSLKRDNESFEDRLSDLERYLLIAKWSLIGLGIGLIFTKGSVVIPLIIKLFTKGV